MIYELVYTSAPAGLRPGSSGYSTVQSSRGIPAPTVDLLESLSGYRHVFTAGTPAAAKNPVNFGHYLLRVQGRVQHVLSRVSDCPLDHTGRSNKLGHHLVLDQPEAVPAGPAWLLQQPGWMIDRWDGEVKTLNTVRKPPQQARPAAICQHWHRVTGDAGWAGVVAEAFLEDPQRKVFFIYQPGLELLTLIEEALALLPPSRRWEVTFATYGAALPATVDCLWSGVLAGSQEEHFSKRFVNALRIDLTKPAGPVPQNGPLIALARTGKTAATPPTAHPPVASLPPHLSPPPAPAASRPIQPPRSGSAPASPVAPPATRAVRKPQSDTFKLILAVILSCLLFGGGTVAAIVYIHQRKLPEPAPLEITANAAFIAKITNPEHEDIGTHKSKTEEPIHTEPTISNINQHEINKIPSSDETIDMFHNAVEGNIKNAPQESDIKSHTKSAENKLQTEPTADVQPSELKLIHPEYSALLRTSETSLTLPKEWGVAGGEIKSTSLVFPILNAVEEGSDYEKTWPITKINATPPKLVNHPVNQEKTQHAEYNTHDFVLYQGESPKGTVSALERNGHIEKILFRNIVSDIAPFILNSALIINYENATYAISFRKNHKVAPLKITQGVNRYFYTPINKSHGDSQESIEFTPHSSTRVSGEVVVEIGTTSYIFSTSDVTGAINTHLKCDQISRIKFVPLIKKISQQGDTLQVFEFDHKLMESTVALRSGEISNKNDTLKAVWERMKSTHKLDGNFFHGIDQWEILDPENKLVDNMDIDVARQAADMIISKVSNEYKDEAMKFKEDRLGTIKESRDLNNLSSGFNNAIAYGFSIINTYEFTNCTGEKQIIEIPIITVEKPVTE